MAALAAASVKRSSWFWDQRRRSGESRVVLKEFGFSRCYPMRRIRLPRGRKIANSTEMKTLLAASDSTATKSLLAIGWAGLIAGVLDLLFAAVSFVIHGRSPYLLLKIIAGGALGRGATDGGLGTAALGLVFHFCISLGAAAVYFAGSRRIPWLNRHPWISGPVFGLLVYEFMQLVVLPLSAYRRPFTAPPLLVPDVLSHLFFVGLPIALIIRRDSESTPKIQPAPMTRALDQE